MIGDYHAKQKKQKNVEKMEGSKQKEEEEEENNQKKKDLEKQENKAKNEYHAHKKTIYYYKKFQEIFKDQIFFVLYTPYVSKTTIRNLIYEGK